MQFMQINVAKIDSKIAKIVTEYAKIVAKIDAEIVAITSS